MKRMMCLILCVLMAVGIFAGCEIGADKGDEGAAGKAPGVFQVGYSAVDITPDFAVNTSSSGVSTDGAWEHLYTTCIAMQSADGRIYLIYHNDLVGSNMDPIGFIIKKINKETGVPSENVMVHATHTHLAPRINYGQFDNIVRYNDLLEDWMVEAAVNAIADLKPAKMFMTSIETKNMNFIRHYYMKDGTVSGDNFGSKISGYKDQVADPDPMLSLVKFTREGCKDIIMANFQTHPHRARGNVVTSDIVGVMREEVEALLNCEFAYFTGAAGNINPTSKIAADNVTATYQEQGVALADYAVKAAANFEEISTGEIGFVNYVAKPELKEGVASAPDVNMNVLSVGDFAFVAVPYEMFDSNGRYIKENSPFKMTFIATLGYYAVPYIPDYDGYEYEGVGLSYEGNECLYARGTGEKLAEKYVEMLKSLKK